MRPRRRATSPTCFPPGVVCPIIRPDMKSVQQHLRDTFLAGIFAGVPIVVTVIIVMWVDATTQQVFCKPLVGKPVPLVGIIMAIAALYLVGVIVRSLVGRQILASVDALLLKLPVIRPVYEAWKQVSLTPGGKGGMFAKVVLVPVETGDLRILGFTSGEDLPEMPGICPVFIPNTPNPITGRLYFVPREKLTFLEITPEEGLKLIVSLGNYIPDGVRIA